MAKKDFVKAIKCNQEVYSGYYSLFVKYIENDPIWALYMEKEQIKYGMIECMHKGLEIHSKNGHIDLRADDIVHIDPACGTGSAKAKQIISKRRSCEQDLGSTIMLLTHPDSLGMDSYLQGFKEAWEEERYKHYVFVILSG